MAFITPVTGDKIFVKVGNGAEPEVFTHSVLVNTTRGISFTTSAESDELIDLADQGAPAQTIRRIKSTDFKVDGAGMLDKASAFEFMEWATSGEVRNVQITDGTWIITGPMVLSSYQIDADRLKSATCQITLEQAGAMSVAEV